MATAPWVLAGRRQSENDARLKRWGQGGSEAGRCKESQWNSRKGIAKHPEGEAMSGWLLTLNASLLLTSVSSTSWEAITPRLCSGPVCR